MLFKSKNHLIECQRESRLFQDFIFFIQKNFPITYNYLFYLYKIKIKEKNKNKEKVNILSQDKNINANEKYK